MSRSKTTPLATAPALAAPQIAALDEDLALTLPYCVAADAPRVLALFALAVELRRIPGLVREPPIGEIRLQWWREALDEIAGGQPPRGHPVLLALAEARVLDAATRRAADVGIDARARLLYRDPFDTIAELTGFFEQAEGWLTEALTPVDAASAARRVGGAYGLARWGRGLAPALGDAIGPAALESYRRSAPQLSRLGLAATARVLYLSLTPGYARRGSDAPWPIARRLTLARAMLSGRL